MLKVYLLQFLYRFKQAVNA